MTYALSERCSTPELRVNIALLLGIEPRTFWLTINRSTAELKKQITEGALANWATKSTRPLDRTRTCNLPPRSLYGTWTRDLRSDSAASTPAGPTDYIVWEILSRMYGFPQT